MLQMTRFKSKSYEQIEWTEYPSGFYIPFVTFEDHAKTLTPTILCWLQHSSN